MPAETRFTFLRVSIAAALEKESGAGRSPDPGIASTGSLDTPPGYSDSSPRKQFWFTLPWSHSITSAHAAWNSLWDTKPSLVLHQELLCSSSWNANLCHYLASIFAGKSGGHTAWFSLSTWTFCLPWLTLSSTTNSLLSICKLKSKKVNSISNFHIWPDQERMCFLPKLHNYGKHIGRILRYYLLMTVQLRWEIANIDSWFLSI